MRISRGAQTCAPTDVRPYDFALYGFQRQNNSNLEINRTNRVIENNI